MAGGREVSAWPVTLDAVFGCWIWIGKKTRDGLYGLIWRGRRPSSAHRTVYESEVGPVPKGLVMDHLCRRPLCVAPHHLEPVRRHENELRKGWRYRASKATCKAGHDMKLNAVLTPEGGRICRQCNQEARRAA